MKSFLVIIAALLHPFPGFGQDGVEPPSSRGPILVAPADSATSVRLRPLFVWSRVTADSQYVLQIAADTSFLAPILADTVASDTARVCPVVLPNDSTFFWRVGILGPAPDSLFSATRTFRTTRLPVLSTGLLGFPDTRKSRDTTREVLLYNPMSDTLIVDSAWSRTAAWRIKPCLPDHVRHTRCGFRRVPGGRLGRHAGFPRPHVGHPRRRFSRVPDDRPARHAGSPKHHVRHPRRGFSRTPGRPPGVTPALPCPVAPGDSLVLRVTYRPEWFGAFQDTLHVATNAGLCALPLAGLCSPPVLSLSPSFVALGPVAFTDTGQVSVVIHNSGPTNDLTLRTLRTRTPLFSFSPAVFSAISPGDSQRVRVKFHMRALRREMFGVYFDTLLVDSDGGRERVLIRGESPPPQIGVEPVMLNFGDVAARDTLQHNLRIVNGSINTLRLDSLRTRGRSFNPGIHAARSGKRTR